MPINGLVTLPPISVSTASALPPFGVAEIRKRTYALQEVMRGVMKEGTHYGTIPGTPKPSLWKAGAEMLCMTFRLAPMLESRVTVDDLEAEWSYTGKKRDGTVVTGTCVGFFEVESVCTIQGPNGEVLSRCSARCNNREAKYRGMSVFEIRNTVLKISEKRAFVSAVLLSTGASDIFTQDLEDFPELLEGHVIPPAPVQSTLDVPEPQPMLSPSTTQPKTSPRPESKAGQGLSPRREAWLIRVAQESKVGQEVVNRCLAFLRGAPSAEVRAFFDELARRKWEAFRRFAVEAT